MTIPIWEPDERGWRRWKCEREGCTKRTGYTPHTAERIFFSCNGQPLPGEIPDAKPGTELKELLASLGASPTTDCNCAAMVQRMDAWGVVVCRRHREIIVRHLQDAYAGLNWAEVGKASAAAVKSGLVLKIKPWDVCGSLLDEAIRRAEASISRPKSVVCALQIRLG